LRFCTSGRKETAQKNTQLSPWWKANSSSYEICLRLLLCHGVLLRTRSAHRLNLQHLAPVPTPNIAELVPFFLFTTMVFAVVRTLFPGKNTRVHVFLSMQLRSINSSISIKINADLVHVLVKPV